MYVVGYLHKKGLKVAFNSATPVEKRQKASYEIRKPGEPVPEADHWKENVLQSLLNLRWLQSEAEYEATKASYEAKAGLKKAAPKPAAQEQPKKAESQQVTVDIEQPKAKKKSKPKKAADTAA